MAGYVSAACRRAPRPLRTATRSFTFLFLDSIAMTNSSIQTIWKTAQEVLTSQKAPITAQWSHENINKLLDWAGRNWPYRNLYIYREHVVSWPRHCKTSFPIPKHKFIHKGCTFTSSWAQAWPIKTEVFQGSLNSVGAILIKLGPVVYI